MYCDNCEGDLGRQFVQATFCMRTYLYCSKECCAFHARPLMTPVLQIADDIYSKQKEKEENVYEATQDCVGPLGDLTECEFYKMCETVQDIRRDVEMKAMFHECREKLVNKNSFKNMRAKLEFMKLHLHVTSMETKAIRLIVDRKQSLFRLFKTKIAECYDDLLQQCPNDQYLCETCKEMKAWSLLCDMSVYFV